jgi:hypothetical protein
MSNFELNTKNNISHRSYQFKDLNWFYILTYLGVLVFFSQPDLKAQNQKMRGQFTGEDLEKSFINVINLNQYTATISQLDGKFEIQASTGDSILISSIQYSEIKFVVKEEYFKDGVEIPLKLKVNELNQVDIYSLGLSGNLEKDVRGIKTNDFSQTQLGFPAYVERFTREERRLHSATSSQGGLPLDYLFNLINGNIKMYKQLVEYERTDRKKDKLFQIFPERFYQEDLNVPDNLIEDFIYYCAENNDEVVQLIRQQNKLLLMELLPKLAEEYLSIKENEKKPNNDQ